MIDQNDVILRDQEFEREHKKRTFVACLAETCSIKKAAEAAGVKPDTIHQWAKKDSDFYQRVEEARYTAAAVLEEEALRRAVHGVKRLRFQNGKPLLDPETGKPYVEYDYSDRLLTLLLRRHDPAYRDEVTHNHNHSGSITHKASNTEQLQDRIREIRERRMSLPPAEEPDE